MTVFDCPILDNYELLKVILIIDLNLFKGKDITFGLVFRHTIKKIINEIISRIKRMKARS